MLFEAVEGEPPFDDVNGPSKQRGIVGGDHQIKRFRRAANDANHSDIAREYAISQKRVEERWRHFEGVDGQMFRLAERETERRQMRRREPLRPPENFFRRRNHQVGIRRRMCDSSRLAMTRSVIALGW